MTASDRARDTGAQREALVQEFTHQSRAFNASPVHSSAATLDALVGLLPAAGGERWLEAACGPGIVSRALAPRVGSVQGVDLTPAMVELAAEEAARAGIANASFAVGDATSLDFPDASFDGAVTRFSLHHIPLPGRAVAELARVVRPGGHVALADHTTSPDAAVAAWHQELERLRDPSHWACLTPARLRELAAGAGLLLEEERLGPLVIDYEEWLMRGSGGPHMRELIEQGLGERPAGDAVFRVEQEGGRRLLHLELWLSLWRRP